MTETSKEEKYRILKLMAATDDNKGMMHEGFDKNDPSHYTERVVLLGKRHVCGDGTEFSQDTALTYKTGENERRNLDGTA